MSTRATLLLATYFLLVGLSLHVLAFLLYRHDPHDPKLRFVTVVTVLLGVVSLAVALLLWVGDQPSYEGSVHLMRSRGH